MVQQREEPGKVWTAIGFIVMAGIAALVIWGIIAAVHGISHHTSSKPATAAAKATPAVEKAPKYYAGTNPDIPIEQTVQPLDAKTMQVQDQVINSGNAPGKPVCTIQLGDFSTPYHGTDIVTDPNDLQPGKTWNFTDQITITSNGAEQTSSLKQVVDCK